jgi:hypothetical protein
MQDDSLDRAARLAGYFAAHAVWSVEDGEVLIPLVGFERGEHRKMLRFAADELTIAVARARSFMAENPEHADHAALVVDGFVGLEGGRTDALIVDVTRYEPRASLQIIVPYRSAKSEKGFVVHRPKFAMPRGFPGDIGEFGRAFFEGAATHEQAWASWQAHKDESR